MNIRLLRSLIFLPFFIACQAGSEFIPPDTADEGDTGFTCTVSADKIEYGSAYDYEPFAMDVTIGEEAALVDLSGAPWLEIEDNIDLLYPDSHKSLIFVPKEPNYSTASRSGIIALKGKYTGKSIELHVSQAGSSQNGLDSKTNTWSLTDELVSSDSWIKDGLMTANQGDMNAILSLEHSVNSPVEVILDEGRGTFKGMKVGDAILMRMPVKNIEPGTGVYAMVNLSQISYGIESQWVAEYWEGGTWNAKETFSTTRDTEEFTYKSCFCEYTVAEPVVDDYIKVRFRKTAGDGVVTNFIAAAPMVGADMKLTVPKKPLVLTLNFATWPLSGTPPTAAKKTTAEEEYTLTQDDQTYKFMIHAPATGYYFTGSALRFQDEGGGYVKLPAIEDRKLKEITVGITNGSAKAVILSTDGSDKGDIVSSISIPSKGEMTFTLPGTQENTSYYLYTKTKHTQIGKIVLVYE